ncbi:MAG: F0F1 ATP synthase subunit gamma [Candidatus Saccharibacteria bacterium]
MKNSIMFKNRLQEITTIQNLTAALEGVASIKIARIKQRVLPGRECFEELWRTYSQLRIDSDRHKRFISTSQERFSNHKTLYIIITSDGNLSGLIDQKIINYFLSAREEKDAEIAMMGSHGASILEKFGMTPNKVFSFPEIGDEQKIQEMSHFIDDYAKITVFYQSYVSLSNQTVRTIDLLNAVATLGDETAAANPAGATTKQEVISSHDYFFEPSLKEIIKTMEATMLQIALREVILDSHLAQLASRFNAMLVAEDRARKQRGVMFNSWHKAKRDENDKQLRESVTTGEAI